MARLAAILKALWRAFQRGEKSIATVAGNNFFLVALLFLGKAGSFLFLIMGLVILFPLSTDPLRKIPPSRPGSAAACVRQPCDRPRSGLPVAGLAEWERRRP